MTPLLRRLAMLFRRNRLERELEEEMRAHVPVPAEEASNRQGDI